MCDTLRFVAVLTASEFFVQSPKAWQTLQNEIIRPLLTQLSNIGHGIQPLFKVYPAVVWVIYSDLVFSDYSQECKTSLHFHTSTLLPPLTFTLPYRIAPVFPRKTRVQNSACSKYMKVSCSKTLFMRSCQLLLASAILFVDLVRTALLMHLPVFLLTLTVAVGHLLAARAHQDTILNH